MAKLRIVIADDSRLMRELLRGFLSVDPDIEVVGEAANGREAVDLVRRLNPDLITLDLEMPVMGGLEAIEELMADHPLPILVVSSVANAQNAYAAVLRGALDVVSKPVLNSPEAKEIVGKVRMLAKMKVITHMRPGQGRPATGSVLTQGATAPHVPQSTAKTSSAAYQRVFAIASSTGGPRVLAQILPRLPQDFGCPVIIAQHIAAGFAPGMAEWLGSLCKLPVKMAAEGMTIEPATIYIAPSERNLSVTSGRRLTLVDQGPLDVYRPSCDVLLSAVAEVYRSMAVGIILTGMGSDGCKGLGRIREFGGMTLGQDEDSSVIYGMNKVAIEKGVVQRVFSVEAIADEMLRLAKSSDLMLKDSR